MRNGLCARVRVYLRVSSSARCIRALSIALLVTSVALGGLLLARSIPRAFASGTVAGLTWVTPLNGFAAQPGQTITPTLDANGDGAALPPEVLVVASWTDPSTGAQQSLQLCDLTQPTSVDPSTIEATWICPSWGFTDSSGASLPSGAVTLTAYEDSVSSGASYSITGTFTSSPNPTVTWISPQDGFVAQQGDNITPSVQVNSAAAAITNVSISASWGTIGSALLCDLMQPDAGTTNQYSCPAWNFQYQGKYIPGGAVTLSVVVTDASGLQAINPPTVTGTFSASTTTPTHLPNRHQTIIQCASISIPTGWVVTAISTTSACASYTYTVSPASNGVAVCVLPFGKLVYPAGYYIMGFSITPACGGYNPSSAWPGNTFTIHQAANGLALCVVGADLYYPAGYYITGFAITPTCGSYNSLSYWPGNTFTIQQAANGMALCVVGTQLNIPTGYVITGFSITSTCGGYNPASAWPGNTFTIQQAVNGLALCVIGGQLNSPTGYLITSYSVTAACGPYSSRSLLPGNTYTIQKAANMLAACESFGSFLVPTGYVVTGFSDTAACGSATPSAFANTYVIRQPTNNLTVCYPQTPPAGYVLVTRLYALQCDPSQSGSGADNAIVLSKAPQGMW